MCIAVDLVSVWSSKLSYFYVVSGSKTTFFCSSQEMLGFDVSIEIYQVQVWVLSGFERGLKLFSFIVGASKWSFNQNGD